MPEAERYRSPCPGLGILPRGPDAFRLHALHRVQDHAPRPSVVGGQVEAAEHAVHEQALRIEEVPQLREGIRPHGRRVFVSPLAVDHDLTRLETTVQEIEGAVLEDSSFDLLHGRFETRQVVIDRKGRHEYAASVRAYTLAELRDLLDSEGLFVHRVLGGLDLSPYNARARRMVLYAVKGVEPEGIRTAW